MKITDFIKLLTPAANDVIVGVDVSEDITKKIELQDLPVSNATQTALNAKQNTITGAATTIDTEDLTASRALVSDGSGKVAVSSVTSTELGYVSGVTSAIQTQLDAKQATLVSGTNIKTINSTSLLGSGDIAISANPAGTVGQIQFSDGSSFAADSNLFWSNTSKRLGIGTSSPGDTIEVQGTSRFRNIRIGEASNQTITDASRTTSMTLLNGVGISTYTAITPTAQLHIKGSGSTSATTSLLVQNSAGSPWLDVRDNGEVNIGGNTSIQKANLRIHNSFEGSLNFTNINFANWNGTVFSKMSGIGPASATFIHGGTSIHSSASMQIDSTTKGFLPPRMTTTQKNAISSPAAGLQVYDTTLNQMSYYNGTSWVNF